MLPSAAAVDSAFYVVRPADAELRTAIARQDSLVLIKGARQMGKTSLLARGLQQAREAGARVVPTDIQKLNASELESAEAFCLSLAERLADRLRADPTLGTQVVVQVEAQDRDVPEEQDADQHPDQPERRGVRRGEEEPPAFAGEGSCLPYHSLRYFFYPA